MTKQTDGIVLCSLNCFLSPFFLLSMVHAHLSLPVIIRRPFMLLLFSPLSLLIQRKISFPAIHAIAPLLYYTPSGESDLDVGDLAIAQSESTMMVLLSNSPPKNELEHSPIDHLYIQQEWLAFINRGAWMNI